jgi:hypothetical protein
LDELGPFFAGFTLAFALELRKNAWKTSARIVGECQSEQLRAKLGIGCKVNLDAYIL